MQIKKAEVRYQREKKKSKGLDFDPYIEDTECAPFGYFEASLGGSERKKKGGALWVFFSAPKSDKLQTFRVCVN